MLDPRSRSIAEDLRGGFSEVVRSVSSCQRTSAVNEIDALFRRLSAGVYVIGAAQGERRGAFTAAWIMQASYEPPLIALSVNPNHATYPLLNESRTFTVSVLKAGQLELARRFGTQSGRDLDKLAGIQWQPTPTGAPILDDALAFFECEVVQSVPAGDHELVIGHVVAGAILDHEAAPMAYAETGDMDGSSALYPTA